ncbi:hydroxyacylglutathione hydrolase [Ferrigenium kumadai]|uniref:Hydroxyacylglutathione hydrolase n=1 Tax=Ferrigenium kumadai TaxID=1682490 RepID=A0AAN1T0T2_9PROT|nr:hydroxyacylglutathione hydrolase [Ferrigenium kumadai]BBI99765.1 hydroxyacylglutathione hydrolase [Ferrigenium kumadai]
MLDIAAIPALRDNYIWIIHDGRHALVVDPGEAAPALEFLAAHGLRPRAILCTHRHADHTGGIAELHGVYNVPVYGRRHPNNPHITHDLHEGDRLEFDAPTIAFDIIEIPGHLDDHIAFVGPDILFCGDVMFGAGCGRNFEGTPAQLHHSLQRLAALPDTTRVYCAHEYTEANLRFALACEPDNPDVHRRIADTQRLRAASQPSLPSTIAQEKATNPFLRCNATGIVRTLERQGLADTSEIAVFTALREWRNHF